MAQETPDTAGREQEFQDNFYVLAGWSANNLGPRLVLKLQAIQAGRPGEPHHVHRSEFYLNKTQAAQLGQFLFHASGQTPPKPRLNLLDRWLGRWLGR